MVLGADGVQMGSRFVASTESSAHENFKNEVINSSEGATRLALKKLIPVRLLYNNFADKVEKAELEGRSVEFLKDLLGKARSKQGMFEGDIVEGELEIGQIAALLNKVEPAKNIISDIILEYKVAKNQMSHIKFEF